MPGFTTNAQFLRYAEDEYLSEFMLRAMTPKPSKATPTSVTFEWGLVVGEQKMQMYSLEATGVTEWSLAGDWDKHAVVELDLPEAAKGLSLVMKVPGTLRLSCARLSVTKGAIKSYSLPPAIDPTRFLVWGDREVTWNQLREWLAIPDEQKLYDQTGSRLTPIDPATWDTTIVGPYDRPTRVQDSPKDIGTPWIYVMWMLSIGRKGHYFSIHRGTCSDEAWARIVRLPERLGPGNVMSGSIKCTSAVWMKKWAAKAASARTGE